MALCSSTFLAPLVASLVLGIGGQAKVPVCHVPPDDPENAHILEVAASALDVHLAHGDFSVPDELGCTTGVGECAVDGFLECTAGGMTCDAVATDPPEEVETSCSDGRDNDCDGSIDEADADCAVCPTGTGLEAAILRQVEHEGEGSCTVDVQIGSLTDPPVRLLAQSVDAPDGVLVASLQTSSCTQIPRGIFCRHDMTLDYTTSASFDGDYVLHLDVQCDPVLPGCSVCSGEEVVEFTLDGTACDEEEIPVEPGDVTGLVWFDTDGDGAREEGELPLGSASGVIVEIYADVDPFDGLPDGAALAQSPTDENGFYGFTGLDGTYVLKAFGAGSCSSSGPDSETDPSTGFTFPITVLAASPKQVLSGLDIGLTSVCTP